MREKTRETRIDIDCGFFFGYIESGAQEQISIPALNKRSKKEAQPSVDCYKASSD